MPVWLWVLIGVCLLLCFTITILYFQIGNLPAKVSRFTKRYKLVGVVSEFVASVLFVLYLLANTNNSTPFNKACIIFFASIIIVFIIFRSVVSLKVFATFAGIFIISLIVSFAYSIFLLIGLSALFGVSLGFLIISIIAQKHALFINTAKSVCLGATAEELQKIFGEPTSKEEEEDGKLIITYEKTQWRGFLRGGTIVRSVKVTLVDEKVVKVTTKNMDVPVW